MTDSLTPWIHLVAVAVWLGPQFFMFLVTVPALRAIEDQQTRVKVMRLIIYRFGWLAWIAMAVIVLSGISNLFQVGGDTPLDWASANDIRYGRLFAEKMFLVGVTVVLTAVHTVVVGPRQLALNEQMDADPTQASRLRRLSIVMMAVALLARVLAIF